MNKHKIVIILFFMGLSLFFIPMSYGLTDLINGDFEDGETGWDMLNSSVGSSSWYGVPCKILIPSPGSDPRHCIQTSLDFEGVNQISFRFGNSAASLGLKVWLDSNLIYQISSQTNSAYRYIDVTGYTDTYDLNFELIKPAGGTSYVADIVLTYDAGYPIPTPNEILFYPNVNETENFPLIVNYSVNDSCTGLNQIYVYRNDSHIYTYYLGNSQEGSINMSDLIQPSKNVTYIVTLRSILCDVVAYDIIDYIFNETIEFPDPEPTPNITPLPTYTPPPTPIPPTQPQIDNGTLNMTWLQGYYNLVDGVMNGLFQPIFNATGYFMFPMTLILDGGGNVMTESVLIFDIVEEKILIATSILAVFFNSIPDKVTYLMIYYLSWLVILILFKGET